MWLITQYKELSTRTKLVAIGLLVFGLAMLTNLLPFYWYQSNLELMRVLQFAATLALLFGVLRSHPKYEDKFMLFWMAITSFCFISILYAGLMHLTHGGNFHWVLMAWSIAAVVAALLNIVYIYYVELTIGAEGPVTKDLLAKQPPSYAASNPQNIQNTV